MDRNPGTPNLTSPAPPARPMLRMDAVAQLVVEAEGVGYDKGVRAGRADQLAVDRPAFDRIVEEHNEELAKLAVSNHPTVGYLSWNIVGEGLWFTTTCPQLKNGYIVLAQITRDGNVMWTQEAMRVRFDATGYRTTNTSAGGEAPEPGPSVEGDAVTTGPPPEGWAATNGAPEVAVVP